MNMKRRFNPITYLAVVSLCLSAATATVAAGPDNLTISIQGECPSRLVLAWSGVSPNEWAALAFSQAEGQVTLPMGPCAGTVLGLSPSHGFGVLRTFRTGSEGRGEMTGSVRTHHCGGYFQMIVGDGSPCATSNVVQIPQ